MRTKRSLLSLPSPELRRTVRSTSGERASSSGSEGQPDHVGRGDLPHLRQGDLHVDAVDPVPLAVEAVEGPLLGGEAPGEEAEGHAQAEAGEVDGRVQAVAHQGAPGDDPVVAQHGYSSLTNTSTPQYAGSWKEPEVGETPHPLATSPSLYPMMPPSSSTRVFLTPRP